MKNLLNVMFIVFSLFLTSQSLIAQERAEDRAKMQVAELSDALELNGEQQRALFRAFVKKEAAYSKQITGYDLSDTEVIKAKKEIDDTLLKEIKEVLTAEQFKKYQNKKE